MIFTQYYLDCLSQASYLIGDEVSGRAVVVDPRRDVAEYVSDASAAGLSIELVIETHFHADFLSGHLELAAATGAKIAYSSVAETEFEIRKLDDGERIELGGVALEIRHTPGHTPESISIVVWEHDGDVEPYAVLTGDTLFIGDVGRPDLLSSIGVTKEELADQLYDSLHNQLMTLPDATRVYPGHGAGSACGKNLSTDTWSTIGEQRRSNYALLAETKHVFFELVTGGQPPAPSYFSYDAVLNGQDRPLLDEHAVPTVLDLDAFDRLVAGGAMIIDGRDPEDFARGHLPGSINVGLNGRYAEFAGSVIPDDVDIVLVVDDGFEREAKNRLARIGFDRVVGHLRLPTVVMVDNPDRVVGASRLTAPEFDIRRGDIEGLQLVDIRHPGEVERGMIPGASTIPVGQLPRRLEELDPSAPTVVYCAGGYRSSVAASVLRQAGFRDVSDIVGGYGAWFEAQTASIRGSA
ncbi:MAG: glyoxylase-like metal-dependent hydrolase (beta-lactamase superfamily II) [Ilumatobacter sp.]|jgi:glyoxylase-like metal-dependent hydrolase (beta-lactamase superfamily II)/rhodanese-related sulfurtransferase